jgi:hypothetical protein
MDGTDLIPDAQIILSELPSMGVDHNADRYACAVDSLHT